MKVRDIMDVTAPCITEKATLSDAANLFLSTHSSELMVINEERHLVGVISSGDLLRLMIPDLHEFESSSHSPQDIEDMIMDYSRTLRKDTIESYMVRNPITLHPDDNLVKCMSIMLDRHIHNLPVVEYGVFVAKISRTDICWVLK